MKTRSLNITKTHVRRVFNFTDEVVQNYPNRLAGTEACKNAADRIKQEFIKHCDPGSVHVEDFTVHPKSFLKYIPALVVLYFAGAVLLYFGLPLTALVVYGLAIFMFYAQFVRYWELLDPYFPKATGYNVYGSIEPEGEVKQQVVVSAHHDAAYVFQLLAYAPKYYARLINAGILFLLLGFLVSLIWIVLALFQVPVPDGILLWVPVALMVGGIFQLPLAFFTTGEVSPAAGDDMIAVAVAGETARLFHQAKKAGKNPLRHTRLIVASFDAEEAGLRGARAFCNKHGQELLNTKTYVFNIDTLYKLKDLTFLDKDLNSTVRLSRAMAQDCVDTAKSLGYPARIASMPFGAGSTDAAEFGKLGVEAINMAGISFDIGKFGEDLVYHTPDDVPESIEPELVEASLKIVRDYILKKDSQA
ncbi:MAG: M28 family peptidase [Dehalococcoidia bacterium]